MEIIALANHKGGCGKTTTAINLAYRLSRLKQKVLLIDLDPQGHSSLGLNINPDRVDLSCYDFLQKKPFAEVVIKIMPGLDLIPGAMKTAFIEQILAGKNRREYRLKDVLKKVSGYDYALIDSPPSLGLLTINALLAARKVLVPLEPGNYALHGLQKLEDTLKMLQNKAGHKLEARYIVTMFRPTKFCEDFLHTLKPFFRGSLLKTKVNFSELYKDAALVGLPAGAYDEKQPDEYANLAVEVKAWAEGKDPVFISSLPSPVKLDINSNSEMIQMLRGTEDGYEYRYVIDTQGNITTLRSKKLNLVNLKFN
ncbi:MAG: ParA family protein [Candidatus Margulisbacteria bacterium]|jgi:chromosome partitioning protein|nr:ParA family protein [Candidatus Margulisiibacteriota bacterium]